MQRGVGSGGVYVSLLQLRLAREPSGLYAGRRIVAIDGQPTPDTRHVRRRLPHRVAGQDSVRLNTMSFNDVPEVITMKLDPEYWPSYELAAKATSGIAGRSRYGRRQSVSETGGGRWGSSFRVFWWRLLLALLLVCFTYNPTRYNYIRWAYAQISSGADKKHTLPLIAFVGVALLIAWLFYVRTTARSLGGAGVILAMGLCATVYWVLAITVS